MDFYERYQLKDIKDTIFKAIYNDLLCIIHIIDDIKDTIFKAIYNLIRAYSKIIIDIKDTIFKAIYNYKIRRYY